MSRVSKLEKELVVAEEARQEFVAGFNNELNKVEGKLAKIRENLAVAKEECAEEFRAELLAVLDKFDDVEGAHEMALEVVSDKFDLEEVPEPEVVAHREDIEAEEFQETLGLQYPNSEIGAEEADVFVKQIAEVHKNNPAAANATYYMLLDRWSHLFDLDGLAVVKEAKATMDKLLGPPKPKDDDCEIPF